MAIIPIKPASQTGAVQRDAVAAHTQPGAITLAALPPLSLYVHYPWCVRKCPYCDFNSHALDADKPAAEERYLSALVRDLELSLPLIWGRRIHSIFFGGGTPSLMSAAGFDRLMGELRARLQFDADIEITLEANPGTFEAEKFRSYRASGANRLSIGIQSFNPGHLQALGRIHDADEARRAVEIAATHFDNFNLDLMYALPGQKPGTTARRPRHRPRFHSAAPLGLPPHPRTQHLFRQVPAATARRRRRRRHAADDRRNPGELRLQPLRNLGLRATQTA